jgi:hypothetical protein
MSAMVVFRCPTNGHEVESGILTDEHSFHEIQRKEFVKKCPECGREHRWFVAEGQLALSSEPRLPQVMRIH